MTLEDLVSKLRTEIKMDSNDKIWSTSAKESYINGGYLQVQKDSNFGWRENESEHTISLTSGTERYDLPSDFVRMETAVLDTDKTILQETKRNYPRTQKAEQAKPWLYYYYQNKVGMYPVPDSTYTLNMDYRRRLAKLTSTQDLELNDDFADAIVKYAAFLLWSGPRGNQGEAQSKLNDYNIALSTLKLSYLHKNQNLTFK